MFSIARETHSFWSIDFKYCLSPTIDKYNMLKPYICETNNATVVANATWRRKVLFRIHPLKHPGSTRMVYSPLINNRGQLSVLYSCTHVNRRYMYTQLYYNYEQNTNTIDYSWFQNTVCVICSMVVLIIHIVHIDTS